MMLPIVANLILGICATLVAAIGAASFPMFTAWLGGVAVGVALTLLAIKCGVAPKPIP